MNNHVAIRVENLGKRYKIGLRPGGYRTLRESLTRALTFPFRLGRNSSPAASNADFWALKDVSLEIKPGEVVGIIGRNGAGKTTLLKILSRITEPTEGRVEIYGRVGSLLEVGTGFHPELTGRENIYLNGAILGMKQAEIARKFDEIVAFAEVEQFLDTPVKHYSSGMYVRLAFGVAAHLEPEILLVDEVLAVGDAAFQKKCLGKMGDVAREGRTVLFVSHNLTTINSLTNTCVLLDKGKIRSLGSTSEVVRHYLADIELSTGKMVWDENKPGNDLFELEQCTIGEGNNTEYTSDQEILVEFIFTVKRDTLGLRVGYDLLSSEGIIIFRAYHDDQYIKLEPVRAGKYRAICKIPANLFNQGTYYITFRSGIQNIQRILVIDNLLKFSIINLVGSNAQYGGIRPGLINLNLHWDLNKLI